MIPTNTNESNPYDKCSRYNYDSKNKELKLNCNKKLIIKEIKDDYIVFNVDKQDNYFYSSTLDSLNHEFYNIFNMSVSEYITNMSCSEFMIDNELVDFVEQKAKWNERFLISPEQNSIKIN